jgi:SWI/SNF-related matrix-associated actin-dependent regulator 1 of chromatin subfamily A
VKVEHVNGNYILRVPSVQKDEVAALMAYRGLTFSTSASSRHEAILFSQNPYSVCDLAEGVPALAAYRKAIEASRALDGKGTKRLPPGKELWPYQKASLDYVLERDGGILGDQPGLGKTPTSLAFCNEKEAHRVLVIVPASLRLQWAAQIRVWSTIPNVKVSTMLNVKDGIHPTAHYQIISYNAATNPAIIRAIQKYRWQVLICDEAHNMKNADAIRTRAILGNAKGEFVRKGEEPLKAIVKSCDMALALTGTLLLNRPSEAYVLLRHFDWESIDFASEEKFKERYNRQAVIKTVHGKRHNLESTSLESELQNRLRVNIMARHEKRDVFPQMKPPRFEVIQLAETGAVKKALAEEGMLDIDIESFQTNKNITVDGHVAEVRRLMGVALAPQVAEYAADWLDGSDGEKLVIFAWHIEVLDILEKELSSYGTMRIDGSVSAQNRQKRVDAFIDNPKLRVSIMNMQSGGTGVDGLQKVCSRCFLAEPDWVPAQNEQAVSRLDRIGQENLVTAEIFVAPGSISEKILVKALEKMNTIFRVLDKQGI